MSSSTTTVPMSSTNTAIDLPVISQFVVGGYCSQSGCVSTVASGGQSPQPAPRQSITGSTTQSKLKSLKPLQNSQLSASNSLTGGTGMDNASQLNQRLLLAVHKHGKDWVVVRQALGENHLTADELSSRYESLVSQAFRWHQQTGFRRQQVIDSSS